MKIASRIVSYQSKIEERIELQTTESDPQIAANVAELQLCTYSQYELSYRLMVELLATANPIVSFTELIQIVFTQAVLC